MGVGYCAPFVDPQSPEVDPVTSQILDDVEERELPASERPEIVAISVNPHGDARANLLRDFTKWQLVSQWRWAIGSRAQLASVWKSYYAVVSVTRMRIEGALVPYVAHSQMTYLIDGSGYERALFGWPYGVLEIERTVRRLEHPVRWLAVAGCSSYQLPPGRLVRRVRREPARSTRGWHPERAARARSPDRRGRALSQARHGCGDRTVHTDAWNARRRRARRGVRHRSGGDRRAGNRRARAAQLLGRACEHARCYGALVTLEPTGVVLARPRAHLVLSQLFRAWGQALSPLRLCSFQAASGARVSVFVNGKRWRGAPGGVPLLAHAEIVLEVGPYVPPHVSYTFPTGV